MEPTSENHRGNTHVRICDLFGSFKGEQPEIKPLLLNERSSKESEGAESPAGKDQIHFDLNMHLLKVFLSQTIF